MAPRYWGVCCVRNIGDFVKSSSKKENTFLRDNLIDPVFRGRVVIVLAAAMVLSLCSVSDAVSRPEDSAPMLQPDGRLGVGVVDNVADTTLLDSTANTLSKDQPAVAVFHRGVVSYDSVMSDQINLPENGWRFSHVPEGFLPELERERPLVGLALSGGGARGLAHIGVLQVFEEEGIPIDIISGTSMGAIVGALYASGTSAKGLEYIVERMDWGGLFTDAPSRRNLFLGQKELANQEVVTLRFHKGRPYIPDALVTGQTLYLEIQQKVSQSPYTPAGHSFEGLRIPLGILATDLNRGERVLIQEGDLSLALRATMALPIVFRALRFRGMLLVDGGAVENIPVRGAIDMGADVVIGVDCSSPAVPDLDPDLPWDIANQVTTLMSAPNDSVSRWLADLVIVPHLNGTASTDFASVGEIIEAGREEAEKNIDKIRTIAGHINGAPALEVDINAVQIATNYINAPVLNPLDYGLQPGRQTTATLNKSLTSLLSNLHRNGYSASTLNAKILPGGILRVEVDLGVLRKIRIEGVDQKQMPFVLREVNLKLDQPLNSNELHRSLIRLYATGRYTTAFKVVERDENGGIILTYLLEKAPLPRMGLGLGFDSDRRSRYFADLAFASPFSGFGDEILFRARYGEMDEYYRFHLRTDRLAKTYIGWQGSAEYATREQSVYNHDGEAIRVGDVYTARARLEGLFNLKTWGGVSAGVLNERIADNVSGDDRVQICNGLAFRGTIDTEDRKPYPTRGFLVDAGYTSYIPELSEEGFNVFDLFAETVWSFTNRWVGRAALTTGVSDLTTPYTHRFAIGGTTSFPAVKPYRWVALRHVGYTFELRYDLISKIVADTYVLVRYDVAGFSDQKDWRPQREDLVQSVALGFALDTFLGPFEIWSAYMPESATAPQATRVSVNFGYRF